MASVSVILQRAALQSFLRCNCLSLHSEVVVTKKNLLDLLERFRPTGSVTREKDQSTNRNSIQKKLSRILGRSADASSGGWNSAKGEHDDVTYDIGMVPIVLGNFGLVLADGDWEHIVANLTSAASQGILQQVSQAGSDRVPRTTGHASVGSQDSQPTISAIPGIPCDVIHDGSSVSASTASFRRVFSASESQVDEDSSALPDQPGQQQRSL